MNRLALAPVVMLLAAAGLAADGGAGPKTHQVRLNGHTFTLPEGFEIEQVAGPPLVNRPIVADFDEDGRLYVADSSGSNDPVKVQLEKKPHRIVRLEDTHGDGKFDKATVFADKMMFPEGVMWLDGSLYVGAPPSIWKLTDTDGDGVADQREEWYKGKTLGGCANDIHGPYAGPDGWVYWCKGGFEQQTYERPGKKPLVSRAAHVLRCRPDGTGLEPVMTGGMDNPVGLVWTPGGEMIFTTTFLQHPAGGKRDGLIHAVYGGVYGKDHGVLDGHIRTSPHLMPVMTHLGAAAPCGLVRYESTVFGKEYQDNLFACLFNMHKVTRHVLVPDGATFKTIDSDFLVSDNLDFHPTDVKEDADGSLLVLDTGGWYKLCCPTSQLHKPDVLGAIYRVRKTGAPKINDPRGHKIDWTKAEPEELAKLLDDERPAARRRAVAALGKRGRDAIAVLGRSIKEGKSVEARRNAVWAATRIHDLLVRFTVLKGMDDPDETVRQVAAYSAGLWKDDHAADALVDLLTNQKSAHNKRVAAEAIGRILGNPFVADRDTRMHARQAGWKLWSAFSKDNDRVLDHSLTYALIESWSGSARIRVNVGALNAPERRAALIALDQVDGGELKAEAVAAELTSPDAALKETAWWVAGRHPEWGDALAGFLRDRLAAKELTAADRDELTGQLARFAKTPAVQELLTQQLREGPSGRDGAVLALHAMARSGLKEPPAAWVAGLEQVLASGDADLIREAVTTARALPSKGRSEKFAAALLRVADDDKAPQSVRLGALAAVPGGLTAVKPATFDFLLARLDREQPVADRAAATDVLARAKLTPEQLLALTAAFGKIAPTEADRLLEAFAQSADDKVGETLIAALKTAPARSSLRPEFIKPRLAKFGPTVQKDAEGLYALLNADLAKQRARLDELLAELKDGDVRRGQMVFNSSKVACSACHAIGYLGGTIGPDLTHIGKVRAERDLLESIVFPSASFVRSYEPVEITTKKGKVYNGLVRRETPDEVVLATSATEEVRVARQDIDEVQPGKVSIMPAGLDQQLTRQELADLVAFLKACK
jgi:putative membrane-bound dehydrogenase-like protein